MILINLLPSPCPRLRELPLTHQEAIAPERFLKAAPVADADRLRWSRRELERRSLPWLGQSTDLHV